MRQQRALVVVLAAVATLEWDSELREAVGIVEDLSEADTIIHSSGPSNMRKRLISLISEISHIIIHDGAYTDLESLQQEIKSLGELSPREQYLLKDLTSCDSVV